MRLRMRVEWSRGGPTATPGRGGGFASRAKTVPPP